MVFAKCYFYRAVINGVFCVHFFFVFSGQEQQVAVRAARLWSFNLLNTTIPPATVFTLAGLWKHYEWKKKKTRKFREARARRGFCRTWSRIGIRTRGFQQRMRKDRRVLYHRFRIYSHRTHAPYATVPRVLRVYERITPIRSFDFSSLSLILTFRAYRKPYEWSTWSQIVQPNNIL